MPNSKILKKADFVSLITELDDTVIYNCVADMHAYLANYPGSKFNTWGSFVIADNGHFGFDVNQSSTCGEFETGEYYIYAPWKHADMDIFDDIDPDPDKIRTELLYFVRNHYDNRITDLRCMQ